jgi:hypothetical protein
LITTRVATRSDGGADGDALGEAEATGKLGTIRLGIGVRLGLELGTEPIVIGGSVSLGLASTELE